MAASFAQKFAIFSKNQENIRQNILISDSFRQHARSHHKTKRSLESLILILASWRKEPS
jgi:hypothetical protein